MRELAADFERWRDRGERVALATVTATRRSAPRPVGAKLAVSEHGELAGSVSGGCVEAEVAEHAREVLAGGPPRLLTFGIANDLALEIGLPCGGEIDVLVTAADLEVVARALEAEGDERPAVLLTDLDQGTQRLAVAGDALADELLAEGRSRLLESDGRQVFADVLAPPPRLLVFGAVDTAEALCAAANAVGWGTVVADPRASLATRERLPSPDELVVAWPEEALAQVGPDARTAVVVLTHEERFDLPALVGALASDAFYVGALGSRRAQDARRERLLEAGVPEDALERLSAPAGLDVGAESSAEMAVSILAEILARRAGRDGGPLRGTAGRIHAEVA